MSKINDNHFGVNPKNNQWEYLGPKNKTKTKALQNMKDGKHASFWKKIHAKEPKKFSDMSGATKGDR